jgi:hypothetical protein
MPPATSKEQFHLMLADLLTQRFHLAMHHESREVSGYELVIAKGTLKLKPSTESQTLAGLVKMPAEELRRPVADGTGLAGKYDYRFEFAPQTGGAPDADSNGNTGPDVFSAVQSQLGMKLIAKKVPVDMLIIDNADKIPTGN